jgi:DNA-directed RNA polymerase subunit M/transcription elongation factor TFIIS
MDLTIEQSCPSCGASIVLREDDRLIQCEFCDVLNYKIGSMGSRYVLPTALPPHVDDDQLFYTPYLRFKGSIFYVREKEVKHKIVDTTRIGLDNRLLPVSLGVRPQAMKMKPVVSSTLGTFILQSVPTKTVFNYAAMVIDLFNEHKEKTTYHRAFIGETTSRIYQPYYVNEEHLVDAVSNRVVGHSSLLQKALLKTCSSKVSWEPRFITTICPGCGGLLSGEYDSMVLQCSNCESLWQEQENKFIPVHWKVVASDNSSARYLPFWQIRISIQGHVLRSFGDFLRFTNQPLVTLPKYDKLPLDFWIPAFKINPKAFLQIASQLTVAQIRIPQGEKKRIDNGYPVTLDRQEALQAVKSVLANTILNREKRFPLLPNLRLGEHHCQLTYLPFVVQSHDLVQEHTYATIQTAALRYGRSL